MRVLKNFIKEELVWNYWLRRPRNNIIRNVGSELEGERKRIFDDAVSGFEKFIADVKHSINIASSIHDLEDRLISFGIDAYDVAQDVTVFEDSVNNNDLPNVKLQLVNGIDSWKNKMVKNSRRDGYNFHNLQHFIDKT